MRQFVRYYLAGYLVFTVDYSLVVLLKEGMGFHYLLANGIAFCGSVTVSYFCGTRIVFKSHSAYQRHYEIMLFFLLNIIRLALCQVLLWFGTSVLGAYYLVSKLGTTVVSTIYSFIMQKVLLDRKQKKGL